MDWLRSPPLRVALAGCLLGAATLVSPSAPGWGTLGGDALLATVDLQDLAPDPAAITDPEIALGALEFLAMSGSGRADPELERVACESPRLEEILADLRFWMPDDQPAWREDDPDRCTRLWGGPPTTEPTTTYQRLAEWKRSRPGSPRNGIRGTKGGPTYRTCDREWLLNLSRYLTAPLAVHSPQELRALDAYLQSRACEPTARVAILFARVQQLYAGQLHDRVPYVDPPPRRGRPPRSPIPLEPGLDEILAPMQEYLADARSEGEHLATLHGAASTWRTRVQGDALTADVLTALAMPIAVAWLATWLFGRMMMLRRRDPSAAEPAVVGHGLGPTLALAAVAAVAFVWPPIWKSVTIGLWSPLVLAAIGRWRGAWLGRTEARGSATQMASLIAMLIVVCILTLATWQILVLDTLPGALLGFGAGWLLSPTEIAWWSAGLALCTAVPFVLACAGAPASTARRRAGVLGLASLVVAGVLASRVVPAPPGGSERLWSSSILVIWLLPWLVVQRFVYAVWLRDGHPVALRMDTTILLGGVSLAPLGLHFFSDRLASGLALPLALLTGGAVAALAIEGALRRSVAGGPLARGQVRRARAMSAACADLLMAYGMVILALAVDEACSLQQATSELASLLPG